MVNMIEVIDPINTNYDEIDIDSYWNKGQENENKNHRIHAYPAKFPAFIAQKAIQYARSQNVNVKTISDIFCGCGTVALEAKRAGLNFWGCDLNPTAVLIAKAKSISYNKCLAKAYYEKIISLFQQLYPTANIPKNINTRIKYWFNDEQIKDLALLSNCIYEVIPSNSKYLYFFLCGFSNILKGTSKWLTKSIKPQIDPNKMPADVLESFRNQCVFMIKALSDKEEKNKCKIVINQQNALKIKRQAYTDLIITSPPYVTSYEYADLHQLSTLWLHYAEDYRDLRKDSIGSNHGMFKQQYFDCLNKSGKQIVQALSEVDRSKAKAVANYYCDMQKITDVCKLSLNNNGMAVLVIGNTEYKGVHINNVMHLVESLYDSGFTRVQVTKRSITGKILTPYRNELGQFSSHDTVRKVYSEEFIVIGTCN